MWTEPASSFLMPPASRDEGKEGESPFASLGHCAMAGKGWTAGRWAVQADGLCLAPKLSGA